VGCGPTGQVALNTAEIYNPGSNTFSATVSIPGCPGPGEKPTDASCSGTFSGDALPTVCAGLPSMITSSSASGGVATIVTSSAVDGLVTGGAVEIGGVDNSGTATGYNGIFPGVVITNPSPFTFTYPDPAAAGAGAGTQGVAIAEGTRQCGIVDSVSTLLPGPGSSLVPFGALVTGGDYITFLGQSSQQSFVFLPSYDGGPAWEPAGPLNTPRELPGLQSLSNGKVLVAGGLTGAAGGCVGLPATCTGAGVPNACCTGAGVGATCGPVAVITNSSAETFDPTTFGWTLTTGSVATPGAPGGMSVPRISTISTLTAGPNAGDPILAGGINARTASFPKCAMATGIAQSTTAATDLYNPTTTLFAATGPLNADRGGFGNAILAPSAAFPNNMIAIGGECAEGGLASAPIGSAQATATCGFASYTSDYYELFDPVAEAWTVGAGTNGVGPLGFAANAPASTLLP